MAPFLDSDGLHLLLLLLRNLSFVLLFLFLDESLILVCLRCGFFVVIGGGGGRFGRRDDFLFVFDGNFLLLRVVDIDREIRSERRVLVTIILNKHKPA